MLKLEARDEGPKFFIFLTFKEPATPFVINPPPVAAQPQSADLSVQQTAVLPPAVQPLNNGRNSLQLLQNNNFAAFDAQFGGAVPVNQQVYIIRQISFHASFHKFTTSYPFMDYLFKSFVPCDLIYTYLDHDTNTMYTFSFINTNFIRD